MDFVVVGFGLGALVLLIGLAVRDLAPRLSGQPNPETADSAGDPPTHPRRFTLAKDAPAVWRRACRALGQVIMAGGGVIVIATILGIVGQFDDESGARVVLAAALLAIGAIVLRAGQIGNSIYGADRRARARARTPETVSAPYDSEHISPEEDARFTGSRPSANHLAAASVDSTESESTPAGEVTPSLPDLQTLLGERNGADHRRRDEIITLERFLGLAPEPPAAAPSQAGDTTSPDGAEPPLESSNGAEPSAEIAVASPSDDDVQDTSETTAEIADVAEKDPVDADAEESDPVESEPRDEAFATGPAETEEITDAEERSSATNGLGSNEQANVPHESIAQRS